jgi:hypothetical protein
MRMIDVALKEEYGFLQGGNLQGWLGDYPWDGERNPSWKRPALIVVPGGGYGMVCTDREGEPIALAYLSKGITAFVLHYSVGKDAPINCPLAEASVAVAYIRNNAENKRNQYCCKNDFFLAPATHFKMMVNGRHFKNPFAATHSVINNLQNVGCAFDNEDDTCRQKNQRTVKTVSQRNKHTAQKH